MGVSPSLPPSLSLSLSVLPVLPDVSLSLSVLPVLPGVSLSLSVLPVLPDVSLSLSVLPVLPGVSPSLPLSLSPRAPCITGCLSRPPSLSLSVLPVLPAVSLSLSLSVLPVLPGVSLSLCSLYHWVSLPPSLSLSLPVLPVLPGVSLPQVLGAGGVFSRAARSLVDQPVGRRRVLPLHDADALGGQRRRRHQGKRRAPRSCRPLTS